MQPMAGKRTAADVLDREFLEMRAKVLELAASFDRIDRAEGAVDDDRRARLLDEALEVLRRGGEPNRAERVQLIFSRAYAENWREEMGIEVGES